MPQHFSSPSTSASPMPVTTDALALADFVTPADGQRILDLGTGTGPIALALAARAKVSVLGIDNVFEAIEEAQANLARDQALLQGSVEFQPGDLRNLDYIRELGAFDQVVCNPPYFKLNEGRLPPNHQRASARHELTCTLAEVIEAGAVALADGGVFSVVHVPARLPELLQTLGQCGLSPQALRPIYTARNRDARLVLCSARKGLPGSFRLLQPLHVRTLANF